MGHGGDHKKQNISFAERTFWAQSCCTDSVCDASKLDKSIRRSQKEDDYYAQGRVHPEHGGPLTPQPARPPGPPCNAVIVLQMGGLGAEPPVPLSTG